MGKLNCAKNAESHARNKVRIRSGYISSIVFIKICSLMRIDCDDKFPPPSVRIAIFPRKRVSPDFNFYRIFFKLEARVSQKRINVNYVDVVSLRRNMGKYETRFDLCISRTEREKKEGKSFIFGNSLNLLHTWKAVCRLSVYSTRSNASLFVCRVCILLSFFFQSLLSAVVFRLKTRQFFPPSPEALFLESC